MTDTLSDARERTFLQKFSSMFRKGDTVNDELIEHLEEELITSDIGVNITRNIINEIEEKYKNKQIESEDEFMCLIKVHMTESLKEGDRSLRTAEGDIPTVILVVGVNGTGKTTSIGKLAHLFIADGKKVILGAGDTFRAGAGEQISHWAELTGADIVTHKEGGDSAAVIYDTVEAGIARQTDYIILDTAGRLHTKHDLMKQLEKIDRVIRNKIPDAPHEILLVLDATAGQNGLAQARTFYEDLGVTGIFLAKMDGTARGGIIFAIQKELGIPVKFIGTGEDCRDLEPFKPDTFIERLFSGANDTDIETEVGSGLDRTMSRKKRRKKKHGFLFWICAAGLLISVVFMVLYLFFGEIWAAFISDIIQFAGLD